MNVKVKVFPSFANSVLLTNTKLPALSVTFTFAGLTSFTAFVNVTAACVELIA